MTELPPPNTRRWVARRKAAVVAAVSSGVITVEEACRRYQMSEEELLAWQRAFENYGIVGLSAGYLRQYRSARPPRPADPSPGQVAPARSEDISAKT
jgi:transposase-like protein